MTMTTLGGVLSDLDGFSWKDWVYIGQANISLSSVCLVTNPDDDELGADDFTPIEAEKNRMEEFLSVQDLRSIVENLKTWRTDASLEQKCAAVLYYSKHDSFMPAPVEN